MTTNIDLQVDLRALLDTIGIDYQSSVEEIHSDTNLMILMNFTLQCLGGIRLIVTKQCRDRHAEALQQHYYEDETKRLDDLSNAMRITFVQASNRMLKRILKGSENHDIDPSKHLVESFPNMSTIGKKQWLPLQWAVLGDIETLSDHYSKCIPNIPNIESISSFDSKTDFSILKSPRSKTKSTDSRLEIVELIANNYPDTIVERDKEGRTFLHYACRLESTELIDTCLKVALAGSDSINLETTNANGALPFHNTARFSPSIEVINHVKSLLPVAITIGNNDMTLPLHWAAAKSRNSNIILELWKAYPEAIRTPNNEGYLPLHCAGQNNCVQVVKTVLSLYPDAIKVPDNEGGFPLHHACCFTSSVGVIKCMYDAYPEAMTLAQHSDSVTPLHLAAAQNDSPEIMKFILDVSPNAAYAQDNDGWLPLHCLINRNKSTMSKGRLECLRVLLRANASGATVRTITGETPIDMARALGHGLLVLRLLLNADPTQGEIVYRDMNWVSRKYAIQSVLFISSQRSNYINMLANNQTNNLTNVEIVFIRLCIQFSEQSETIVSPSLLRYIIKFL